MPQGEKHSCSFHRHLCCEGPIAQKSLLHAIVSVSFYRFTSLPCRCCVCVGLGIAAGFPALPFLLLILEVLQQAIAWPLENRRGRLAIACQRIAIMRLDIDANS